MPSVWCFSEKFEEQSGELVWADEHRVGIAKDLDARVVEGLKGKSSRRMF